MRCNIDAKGKAVRLVAGVFSLAAGLAVIALKFSGVLSAEWWWFVVAGAVLGGGFAVFEARAGWCVVRAMGIKTPI